jgi:aminopeptidase YwaD
MKKPFLLLFSLLLSLSMFAQDDQQLTNATVRKAKIESHLQFLASDELRGRDTPSPEQLVAARYLATQLKSYGVKALPEYPDYYQAVKMKNQAKPEEVSLSFNNQNYVVKDHTILIAGNDLQADAEAVFLNFGTEADFKKIDVKGKIVVVRPGLEEGGTPQQWFFAGAAKRKMASEKGAIALVELYKNQQIPWKQLVYFLHADRSGLDDDEGSRLAHIWLHDSDDAILKFLQMKRKPKDKIPAQIKVKTGAAKKFNVYNIVGYLEGNDAQLKNEYVVYSAHYDHVGVGRADAEGDTIYNGARDNAVGTVTVLSAAENLASHPTKRSALFIFFTGEEKGLLGSEWFVNHSPIDLKKMVYCFNSDNAGYNDTSIAMIMGLGRTTADVYIQKACEAYGLKAIDDPAPEQNLFDRSDNVNFAKKGIPAPTFSLGLKAFDADINKYYHQPADQPNNLDYDYLFKFFSAYVYTCRMIGNAAQAPFWKPGDKYYEDGIKLYGKK